MKNLRILQSGFTLVELAVGLIIIGILALAVLQSIEIVNSARIQKSIITTSLFQEATALFSENHNYMPGDHPLSAKIVGSTTNGNGNGWVDSAAEQFLFWQSLSTLDYIQGVYTGTGITAAACTGPAALGDLCIGQNIPKAPRLAAPTNGDRPYYHIGSLVSSSNRFDAVEESEANILIQNGVLPRHANAIDIKIDDGNPATGIASGDPTSQNCNNSDGDQAATNPIWATANEASCEIYIRLPMPLD